MKVDTLIYALVDPRTRLVRYVGKSSSGLKRPRQHAIPSSLKSKCHCSSWIKQLRAIDLRPEIVVLEYTSADVLADRERFWIAYGRASGWHLTNHTDGGDGMSGFRASAETRAKMSAIHRGRKLSPEHTAAIRKGKATVTEAFRQKMKVLANRPEAKARAARLYLTR